jgi:hypothetical protein
MDHRWDEDFILEMDKLFILLLEHFPSAGDNSKPGRIQRSTKKCGESKQNIKYGDQKDPRRMVCAPIIT